MLESMEGHGPGRDRGKICPQLGQVDAQLGSKYGQRPWSVAEQRAMVEQARRVFDQTIYHINSPEPASHYSRKFAEAGLTNVKIVVTPVEPRSK